MKLSEMTMKQAELAVITICDRLTRIEADAEFERLLGTIQADEKQPAYKIIGELIPDIVRFMLAGHREDLYAIVGALTLKTPAEIEEMRVADVVAEIRGSIDKELLGFFQLLGASVKRAAVE